jgi:hypothetical protein
MNTHDAMVQSLSNAIGGFLRDSHAHTVVTNVCWQPLAAFPERTYEFAALVCAEDSVLCRDETRNCFGPELRPCMAIAVLAKGTYDFDRFFDFVDDLARAGVQEIVIWDPTGECMVPNLDGWRLYKGAYRRSRTVGWGVFFSAAGFCLDVQNGVAAVREAGDPRTEEELLTCEHPLSAATIRANADVEVAEGLAAKVNRLRAALGRATQ